MILNDFLSRINVDKSKSYEIIRISFDLQDVLQGKNLYLKLGLEHRKQLLL